MIYIFITGMLTMMDEAIGNINNALTAENMWDDSMVIFMSDVNIHKV